jgi:hypothetical protein
MNCAGCSPSGSALAAGDHSGAVIFLHLENGTPAPPILTAWRSSSRLSLGKSASFGCSHCRRWSKVPETALGTEIPCPHCGKPAKLNPFTIEGDWRPISKAWTEEAS